MNRLQPLPVPPSFGRWMTVLLLTGLILVVSFHAFMTNSRFLLVALACLPLGLLMINRLQAWFILTIGLFYSWIYIPGFPFSLGAFEMFAAAILPFLFVSRLLTPMPSTGRNHPKFFMYVYLAIVLMTMCARGFGLRFLNSEMWGGAAYVHLVVAMIFCILSDAVHLSERQWRITIILFFTAGLIPSAAELMFLISKGHTAWLYYIVRPEGTSALTSLSVLETETGVLRFQVSKYIGFIFVLCLALFPYRRRGRFYIILSGATAFVFAGLSGHRSAILYLIMLIPTLMFLTTKRVPVFLLTGYGVTLAVLALALHFFGRAMPLSFQRSLSWVPFADISASAARSAYGTTLWRLDVWRRVWDLVPDFWLIGRGFAFQVDDYYSLFRSSQASVEWAVTCHNYHNGPLALLVDMGAAGLIVGSVIMIGGGVRHYRLLSSDWANERLARCHRAMLATYCVDVVRFYLIHGDAAYSIIRLLIPLIIMDGLYRTSIQMELEEHAAPEIDKNDNTI